MSHKENHINSPIEEAIHNAIEECRNNPKHGIACIVFSELPQHVVDQMHDEIEQVLEDYFNTTVQVDV